MSLSVNYAQALRGIHTYQMENFGAELILR